MELLCWILFNYSAHDVLQDGQASLLSCRCWPPLTSGIATTLWTLEWPHPYFLQCTWSPLSTRWAMFSWIRLSWRSIKPRVRVAGSAPLTPNLFACFIEPPFWSITLLFGTPSSDNALFSRLSTSLGVSFTDQVWGYCLTFTGEKSYFLGEVTLYGSNFAFTVPSLLMRTIQPSLICVLLKPRCTFNLPELILSP